MPALVARPVAPTLRPLTPHEQRYYERAAAALASAPDATAPLDALVRAVHAVHDATAGETPLGSRREVERVLRQLAVKERLVFAGPPTRRHVRLASGATASTP